MQSPAWAPVRAAVRSALLVTRTERLHGGRGSSVEGEGGVGEVGPSLAGGETGPPASGCGGESGLSLSAAEARSWGAALASRAGRPASAVSSGGAPPSGCEPPGAEEHEVE